MLTAVLQLCVLCCSIALLHGLRWCGEPWQPGLHNKYSDGQTESAAAEKITIVYTVVHSNTALPAYDAGEIFIGRN